MPERAIQFRKKLNGILFCFMSLLLFSEVYATEETVSSVRQAELQNLLLQDCGSCHGMTLKGGLGPALTPEVLKYKSREVIEVTILEGRKGTPMPPWKNILTQSEISWLVDTLYAGSAL